MNQRSGQPLVLVVFGSTGDLTRRKLLPALFNLMTEAQLPERLTILAVGRRDLTDAAYREDARRSVLAFSRQAADSAALNRFLNHIIYRRVEITADPTGYNRLTETIRAEDAAGPPADRLFFLAVAPEFFGLIIDQLQTHQLVEKGNPAHRVLIEKPFGSDLVTARALNRSITASLDEHQIYRIDHYLGKEMIQNILAIRFGNSLFEPLWNHHAVDNIQITSLEQVGVESRGGYYEQAGILKDMLQSHLLQMLALITMEPPVTLDPESIRDEKVKILRALRPFNHDSAATQIVRGQYGAGQIGGQPVIAYRAEEQVRPDSQTLTYMAMKVHVDNFRWSGVPIYIRTGKRLDRRRTQIVVTFRRLPGVNTYADFRDLPPNLLVIEVQPSEGLYFQINAKRPGNVFAMERIELNYCQNCRTSGNVPEAYERLLLEALHGNAALFTRWDELEHAWSFVDSVETACRDLPVELPNYAAGTRGPAAADRLIQSDGRNWWEIDLA
jgi:glucose-6-phosphate 1-dehydrogenase